MPHTSLARLTRRRVLLAAIALLLLAETGWHSAYAADSLAPDSREIAAQEAAQAASTTPVTAPPLLFIVPLNHPAVAKVNGHLNVLRFREYSRFFESAARRESLSVKPLGSDALDIEMRFETRNRTGIAARRYRIATAPQQDDVSYRVQLQPVEQRAYQTKWLCMSLVPIPAFSEQELRDVMLSPTLAVTMEFDSEFGPDSLQANFLRLAQRTRVDSARAEPGSKVLRDEMSVPLRGKRVKFALQIFPYRNGSKAVITAELPSILTETNVVDFTVLLNELQASLLAITRA